MSKLIKMTMTILMFSLSLPIYAIKERGYTITINNHFYNPLIYTVATNQQTVPNLPSTFTLVPGKSLKTEVVSGPEAYISVEQAFNKKNHAYWGVEVLDDMISIHGYLDSGIAYSWVKNDITFCTPSDYKKLNHC